MPIKNPKLELIVRDLIKKRKQRNEARAYAEQGTIKYLEKFHKPVTEQIKEENIKALENTTKLQAIQAKEAEMNQRELTRAIEAGHQETMGALEAGQEEQASIMQDVRPFIELRNLDSGLDEETLEKHGWSLPSKIIKQREALFIIDETIRLVNSRNQSLGGLRKATGADRNEIDAEVKHNKIYVGKLRAMQAGYKTLNVSYTGSGLLDFLTDNRIKNPKDNALKSNIKQVLQNQLKDRQISSDYFKKIVKIYRL